jgi:hypothetical protein
MFENYVTHFFGNNEYNKVPKHTKDSIIKIPFDDIVDGAKIKMIDIDNIPQDLPPHIKSVFDKIKSLGMLGKLDGLNTDEVNDIISSQFNEALGEPTEEHIITKDGVTTERKVWDLNDKEKFTQVLKSNSGKKVKRTIEVIENELKIAVENDEYELAAKLRDEIIKIESTENKQVNKKNKK